MVTMKHVNMSYTQTVLSSISSKLTENVKHLKHVYSLSSKWKHELDKDGISILD